MEWSYVMKKQNKMCIIGLLAVFCTLLCGCWQNRDEELKLEVLPTDEGSFIEENGEAAETDISKNPSEGDGITDDSPATVTVYVCGEVKKPGVYELRESSRVVDALIMAEGFTAAADRNHLNQAELLSDGGMIYVPSVEELENDGDAAEGSAVAQDKEGLGEGAKVNINTADKAQLMTITGVGEAKAEKILAYRQQSGNFNTIEDIMNVPGIKEGMFNKIKDKICVK